MPKVLLFNQTINLIERLEKEEMDLEKDARTKLLEAALPLFPQKGFAGVSIRELADAAGVNSAAISYYFGGKEGLYAAVLEMMFAHIDAAVMAVDPEKTASEEIVKHYARSALAIHQRCPYFIKYLYMELNSPTIFFESIVKKSIGKIYKLLYQSFSRGIEKGHFRSDLDPSYAAVSLAGIINLYFIVKPVRRLIIPERNNGDETYVLQAVETFLNGVRRKDNE
jgi:TetR/AcrR family transcriptional regulator